MFCFADARYHPSELAHLPLSSRLLVKAARASAHALQALPGLPADWRAKTTKGGQETGTQHRGSANQPLLRVGLVGGSFGNSTLTQSLLPFLKISSGGQLGIEIVVFATEEAAGGDATLPQVQDSVADFVDISDLSPADTIKAMQWHPVDMLVFLLCTPLTSYVMAAHLASVQMSYLGFCGTCGSPDIDSTICDPVACPRDSRKSDFVEAVIDMMPSFVPVPAVPEPTVPVATARRWRADAGLSPDAFVFCATAGAKYMDPTTFDSWMAIVTDVQYSVLWLPAVDKLAGKKLKDRAATKGVSKNRLIVPRNLDARPGADRIAAICDLALDTKSANAPAHEIAALLAHGLPVVTVSGSKRCSRSSASLLSAVGFGDMAHQVRYR